MSLSLERLQRVVEEDGGALQRIGLSATQRPLSEIARFLGGQDAPGRAPAGGDRRRRGGEAARDRGDRPGRRHARARRRRAAAGGPRSRWPAASRAGRSIWPAMYPELLALVRAHRSTLVFVNNRRLAERLALRLNELAEEEVARAHHGSLAREQRTLIEEQLKEGALPCLVATSSLELGIDMGAVDLVIQVESPRSVARGMQRIGRAGHQVGAPSRGRVFPKYRGRPARVRGRGRADAPRRDRGDPRPAAAARRAGAAARGDLLRRGLERRRPRVARARLLSRSPSSRASSSRGCSTCSPAAIPRTSSPSFARAWCGTGPPGWCAGATARVPWRSRTRARSPTAGSTRWCCPTAPASASSTRRWSTRPAAARPSCSGASTWRIEEITRDRVVVTPAPGAPGAVPFWKGEGVGRPYELGEAVGRLARELIVAGPERGAARLRAESSFDDRAARNLMNYLEDQAIATGTVPSDRAIVVERFRDEIGDWRLCVLTPFGARVHAPWALAAGARIRAADRPGGAHHLGRRRHRPAPARRRHRPLAGHRPDRPRRARGAGAR